MSNRTRGFVDFRAVKANVSMLQILEHYGLMPTFKRSQNGENLTGPCPIHGGSNPDQFKVSLTKNVWNCFSECKHGGNVLDFVAKKEDCSIREAAVRVATWFNIGDDIVYGEFDETPHRAPSRVQEGPTPPRKAEASTGEATPPIKENKPLGFLLKGIDPGHPYLDERGIDDITRVHFGLGFCSKGTMAGRIAIPICNPEGKTVAYAGRWPGEPPEDTSRYKLPSGFFKSLEVFHIDSAKEEPSSLPLLVVEGFFDAIRLWQLGFKKVVALMGSSLSEEQALLIAEHFPSTPHVIVMFDEDEAGREGRIKAVARLAMDRFVCIFSMDDGQQPEQLREEQLAELRAIYGGA